MTIVDTIADARAAVVANPHFENFRLWRALGDFS